MATRVLVLGAGFGGLELTTILSESLVDDAEVTLIDRNDAFVFGYSKLDVMFGCKTPDAVRLPYSEIAEPGVRFLQATITAIDPEARRVTTADGVHVAVNEPFAFVFTFKGERVVREQAFRNREEALEAVGLSG